LPDATNSITIDGDPALGKSTFGYSILGIGHFYAVAAATTLVVSAPGIVSSPVSSAGHVYAFHGQAAGGGSISIGSADQSVVGPAAGMRIGLVLSNLGPMLGALSTVGVGNPSDTADFPGITGAAYAMQGTAATGPFANKLILSQSGGTGAGGILLGGGLTGRDGTFSLIGNAGADLLLGSEVAGSMVIFDGSTLATKTSPIDGTTAADVKIVLPGGWSNGEGKMSLVPDVNGDGYSDFCLANASAAQSGAVAVYW
jgi:hypothetical protein